MLLPRLRVHAETRVFDVMRGRDIGSGTGRSTRPGVAPVTGFHCPHEQWSPRTLLDLLGFGHQERFIDAGGRTLIPAAGAR